jgi:hypothetical protein
MTILTLFFVIVIIALVFWANNTYVAPGVLRIIINILMIVISILILLQLVGWLPNINSRV